MSSLTESIIENAAVAWVERFGYAASMGLKLLQGSRVRSVRIMIRYSWESIRKGLKTPVERFSEKPGW